MDDMYRITVRSSPTTESGQLQLRIAFLSAVDTTRNPEWSRYRSAIYNIVNHIRFVPFAMLGKMRMISLCENI